VAYQRMRLGLINPAYILVVKWLRLVARRCIFSPNLQGEFTAADKVRKFVTDKVDATLFRAFNSWKKQLETALFGVNGESPRITFSMEVKFNVLFGQALTCNVAFTGSRFAVG
jgi:hypothetical protein